MHSRFCVLLVLLWQITPVLAQPKPTAQKIAYRRDTPKNVAHSIPRRAKRLFWGTFTPQKGAPMIGVQLYESKSSRPDESNSIRTLELWQMKAKRFVRLSRTTGFFEGPASSSAKINAKFYWADSTLKTTPVLVLTQITYGSDNLMPGEYRQIKVVALSAGWKGKPSIQTFYDGSSNAGDDVFSVGYNGAGRLELTTLSGDFSGSVTETYAWDGKEFSSVPEKRKSVSR